MSSTFVLFITACTCVLPHPPGTEPWGVSAAGDDGRLSVTVSVYRDTVAPGERVRIRATSDVLVDGPLRFPQGHHQPLAFIYLETPGGEVIVYPQNGTSPLSFRALEKKDYDQHFLVKKGPAGQVIAYDIPLANPSLDWRDARTLEPIRPDLRQEGVYQAWVRYAIPKVEGVADDAWTGSVETERIRFTVREIPVADRRAEATDEQIAHLEAYQEYITALVNGEDVAQVSPEAIEMPKWLSLENRVQWALQQTENEGFARYVVKQLRKHQPMDDEQEYPQWWDNVSYFVANRAYIMRGYGERPLAIVGPYLEEYAAIAIDELERALTVNERRSSGSSPYHWQSIVLGFVEHEPNSPLRKQMEKLARRYAKIPDDPPLRDRKLRAQLSVAWTTMYRLGMFRDGMPRTELTEMLGEPAYRKDDIVLWNYGTGSRMMEPGVSGKIIDDGQRETIIFTNREHWQR